MAQQGAAAFRVAGEVEDRGFFEVLPPQPRARSAVWARSSGIS